jgi:adenylylsulfate kinase
MMVKELWWRHLIKTGTWRVIAFLALGLISYFLTGSLVLATSIALADWLIKTALYFGHEMIWSKLNIGRRVSSYNRGAVVWFTGLSGSGKTTVADAVKAKLEAQLLPVSRIDGDVARRTFSKNLGFTPKDRQENCQRAAHVASYLKEHSIVLASFISPAPEIREYVTKMCGDKNTFIVHVDCPITVCADRDPKGMYAQVQDGRFMGNPFTGLHDDAPYVEPKNPDLVLKTQDETVDESADKVVNMLKKYGCGS